MAGETVFADATGALIYIRDFHAPGCVDAFDQSIGWRQDALTMYGRRVPLPRLTASYGDPEAGYSYSGIWNEALPWPPALAAMRREVEAVSGEVFNAVLCNRYASGAHYQGFHADDEAALGPRPAVASVTLGAARRFVVRSRDRARQAELVLADGSLVLMLGAFQEHYVHAVPKTARPSGLRINLSFRRIVASGGRR